MIYPLDVSGMQHQLLSWHAEGCTENTCSAQIFPLLRQKIPSPAALVVSLTSCSGCCLCAICNVTDYLFFFFNKNWQCGWHKKFGLSYEMRVLPELYSREKKQKGNSEATKPFFSNTLHKCLQIFYFHLTQVQIPKQVKVNC